LEQSISKSSLISKGQKVKMENKVFLPRGKGKADGVDQW